MRCARAAVVVLSTLLAVGTVTRRAAAQELRLPPDSILVLLASPDWPIRHEGLLAVHRLDEV